MSSYSLGNLNNLWRAPEMWMASYVGTEHQNDDIIYANGGNDELWTTGGQDQLFGQCGNDEFFLFSTENTVADGGKGDDIFHVDFKLNFMDSTYTNVDIFGGQGDNDIAKINFRGHDVNISHHDGITTFSVDGGDSVINIKGVEHIDYTL